uniref:Uncharacterized protein n=1 Tax=Usinis virus TaxID=2800948 RepID=A0A894KPT2_9VIRU|nr:MAG: hypothetical protein [Usinis virus]QRW42682.1 MAG: hypothetical protein [Usinis virus]QRW42683.1 MAG: hypothetical protein [Usinis virus]QRW42685.1 MAG: hypothetical protein [Usinis virus]QRW42686.1 MAG: hypothetical protein [Usinis virus]
MEKNNMTPQERVTIELPETARFAIGNKILRRTPTPKPLFGTRNDGLDPALKRWVSKTAGITKSHVQTLLRAETTDNIGPNELPHLMQALLLDPQEGSSKLRADVNRVLSGPIYEEPEAYSQKITGLWILTHMEEILMAFVFKEKEWLERDLTLKKWCGRLKSILRALHASSSVNKMKVVLMKRAILEMGKCDIPPYLLDRFISMIAQFCSMNHIGRDCSIQGTSLQRN